jgi:hypothetical protein
VQNLPIIEGSYLKQDRLNAFKMPEISFDASTKEDELKLCKIKL